MTSAPCRWSVVIPAFNEERRLPPYLEGVAAYFDGRGESYEVVVVDDGSTDATSARVRDLARAHPAIQVERFDENHGKGYAVRAGMRAARGTLRLMADADGATPIAEIRRLEKAIEQEPTSPWGRAPSATDRWRARCERTASSWARCST